MVAFFLLVLIEVSYAFKPTKLHLPPTISVYGYLMRVGKYFKHNFFTVDENVLAPLGFFIQPRNVSFITYPKLNGCFPIMEYKSNAYSMGTVLSGHVRMIFLINKNKTLALVVN